MGGDYRQAAGGWRLAAGGVGLDRNPGTVTEFSGNPVTVPRFSIRGGRTPAETVDSCTGRGRPLRIVGGGYIGFQAPRGRPMYNRGVLATASIQVVDAPEGFLRRPEFPR